MAHLQVSSIIPAPKSEVFDLLTNPERLAELLADHIEVSVVQGADSLRRGAEYQFTMMRFGLSQSVRLRVENVVRGTRFSYRQTEGLFAHWTHTMKFEDHGEGQTLVTDFVDYQLPFALFGYLLDDLFVRRDMRQILSDRLKRAQTHFERLKRSQKLADAT